MQSPQIDCTNRSAAASRVRRQWYLRCGVLSHGFARFGCNECGHDHLVPLSCKVRGLCPSCGGRRMIALTRHIMDAELPHVPVRQWVLSLPYPLRYRSLTTKIYAQRCIESWPPHCVPTCAHSRVVVDMLMHKPAR
jgi:hypothetical protein